MKRIKNILNRVNNEKLKKNNHKLLYAVVFGSRLYGTDTKDSDIDIKCIFLPSKESCYFCDAPKHFSESTGKSNSKNTKDDVDVELFSLQYFLKLLSKGETNAVDMLYSFTNPDMIVYMDQCMQRLFMNHNMLFDVRNCNAYVGYAIGQAKKYGVKGSRLGVIKKVYEYVMSLSIEKRTLSESPKLCDYAERILEECGDESYCFEKMLKGANDEMIPYLVLAGSKHEYGIKMSEFVYRVKKQYETYGERAKAAMNNKGVDFKALSHAVRAINQIEEILLTGELNFPLDSSEELLKIKNGKYTWVQTEEMILSGLDRIEKLIEEGYGQNNKYDRNFVSNFVNSLYYWG